MTVFNSENTSHLEVEAPLFFGQRLGIHDTINTRHPYLDHLFQHLKQIDWSENEVNLDRDKQQFETCPPHIRDIMIKNLAFQAELDSVASRSAAILIAPFISNSELWRCDLKVAENEVLHAVTYSQIVRMCLKNPSEFFDEVYKNSQVIKRAEKVIKIFNEMAKLGAEYTLSGVVTKEMKKSLVKYWVAMYALERIEFMVSFAATFATAEQGYFLGIASLVQKILKDELSIHVNRAKYVLNVLKVELKDTFEDLGDELKDIIDDVVESEYHWANYLFSEGRSIVGLNENLSVKWIQYCSQGVYEELGYKLPYEKIKETPLQFMDKWINIDKHQVAAQETQVVNYKLNAWVDDIPEVIEFVW